MPPKQKRRSKQTPAAAASATSMSRPPVMHFQTDAAMFTRLHRLRAQIGFDCSVSTAIREVIRAGLPLVEARAKRRLPGVDE